MKLHLLGVCGTFMGGVAQLAAQLGHQVSGCDSKFYQPMSGQLEAAGIVCSEGFGEQSLASEADLYLVGNVVRRGNPAFEAILAACLPFASAPQWLADNCLNKHDKVIAVAGTHGKTTTTAMITHILESLGYAPSYLIGGVPGNYAGSAKLGKQQVMVVEADEYDTALFDKRPKFMHYWSDVMIVNNIEFDHADIYPDLEAVQKQFALLTRMLKPGGVLVANWDDARVRAMATPQSWYQCTKFNTAEGWHWSDDMSGLQQAQRRLGNARALPLGAHNHANALAALVACAACGADPQDVLDALEDFVLPARRMQVVYDELDITLIDDFAHHPTAIAATLKAVKDSYGQRRIVVLFEPRSNTMRAGYWSGQLASSLAAADRVHTLAENIKWDLAGSLTALGTAASLYSDSGQLQKQVLSELASGDVLVMISNGDFAGLRSSLPADLKAQTQQRLPLG